LEPREFWARFDEIRSIPRPSKHEERIRDYALSVAHRHGCETQRDTAGNVVIRVPASPGCEGAPTVILQGHLDMVCEKEAGLAFDFHREGIRLRRNGDRLLAQGTTLGADNGVAIAACLALVTGAPTRHGPLELLFTVDEETGLNGVRELDPALLTGRLLINLDSEEEGVFTIACAGARGAELDLAVEWQGAHAGSQAFRLSLGGATGGHSGGDIHRGRANPIRLLAAFLAPLDGVGIVSFSGGTVRNALAREAEAVVVGDEARLRRAVDENGQSLVTLYRETDPGLTLDLQPLAELPGRIFSATTRKRLLELLARLPHGVLAMSEELPGLVQTSCNVATVRTTAEAIQVHCSVRSALDEDRDEVVAGIARLAQGLGVRAQTPPGYPGWRPNPESRLLDRATAVWRRLRDEEPVVTGVHGGLECGVIGAKIPGMDMISFGPDIANPHSPSEEVSVSSVRRVLGDYLRALLADLAETKHA
jgi:dipeptidase D